MTKKEPRLGDYKSIVTYQTAWNEWHLKQESDYVAKESFQDCNTFVEARKKETFQDCNKFVEATDQHTPGAKMDDGKIDMSLLQLMPLAMKEVCRVMDFGQTKYSRGGFLEVPNAIVRYTAALLRHLFIEPTQRYDSGDPFYDTELGLPFKGTIRHDAQVAVNALFRLECRLREEEMMRAEPDFYSEEGM